MSYYEDAPDEDISIEIKDIHKEMLNSEDVGYYPSIKYFDRDNVL